MKHFAALLPLTLTPVALGQSAAEYSVLGSISSEWTNTPWPNVHAREGCRPRDFYPIDADRFIMSSCQGDVYLFDRTEARRLWTAGEQIAGQPDGVRWLSIGNSDVPNSPRFMPMSDGSLCIRDARTSISPSGYLTLRYDGLTATSAAYTYTVAGLIHAIGRAPNHNLGLGPPGGPFSDLLPTSGGSPPLPGASGYRIELGSSTPTIVGLEPEGAAWAAGIAWWLSPTYNNGPFLSRLNADGQFAWTFVSGQEVPALNGTLTIQKNDPDGFRPVVGNRSARFVATLTRNGSAQKGLWSVDADKNFTRLADWPLTGPGVPAGYYIRGIVEDFGAASDGSLHLIVSLSQPNSPLGISTEAYWTPTRGVEFTVWGSPTFPGLGRQSSDELIDRTILGHRGELAIRTQGTTDDSGLAYQRLIMYHHRTGFVEIASTLRPIPGLAEITEIPSAFILKNHRTPLAGEDVPESFDELDRLRFGVTYHPNHQVALAVKLNIPCPADFDRDGFVDIFDYSAFVECFEGAACPPGQSADFDRDGFVDSFDYDAFIAEFESNCN